MLPDNEFEKTSLEFQLVYGEPLDHREPLLLVDDGSTSENPVAEFLSKVEDEQSLLKNGGSVLDSTWSEELGTPPRIELSDDFLKRSDARMLRVTEQLRKLFGNHEELLTEAISLAEKLRSDTRREFSEAA
jgi:hypothetical protein